ncbi:uncharacterized protein LOC108683215 [Hyalella azteca]|uniref:Uncharacterized protein LOC108683215 n=1 Tax=Hyalella azteca TaxID=294128 RepID=A0A8B7PP71_HYAAZ|nr:uncharacterized protein LOC108683215 [Hyalella azteca]
MGTGDGNMTSASIKNYFSPLEEFLDSEIAAKDIHMTWDEDVDKYFVQHIPPTVPIVVGIVLCAMIVVVVVAYFVGKNRNQKKAEQAKQQATTEKKSGSVNPGFEMAETKSNSSGGSGGSGGS